MITILGLIVNIIEEALYEHLTGTIIYTLGLNKIAIRGPKIVRNAARRSIWICKAWHTN